MKDLSRFYAKVGTGGSSWLDVADVINEDVRYRMLQNDTP